LEKKQDSFPNEDIQKLHYGETLVAECFNLLQKLRQKAHQFTSENGKKQKNTLTKTLFFIKVKIPNWRQISKVLMKSLTLMTLTQK
jgi:hypothetical protein